MFGLLRIPVKWSADSGEAVRCRSEATLAGFRMIQVDLNPGILNLFAKDMARAEALLECTTHILNDIGTVDHSFDLKATYVNEVGEPVEVSAKLMKRYDRQQLYEMVWAMPMNQVASKLRIGSSMPLLCRKLRVPYPPNGYWQSKPSNRAAFGKPALPKIFPG